MSKKLIAVAAAAALALTGLVAVPASAATFGVVVTTSSAATPAGQTAANGDAAATAFGINVPSSNVIRAGNEANGSNSTGTALRLVVTKSTDTAVVTATATGGVLLYSSTSLSDTPTVAGGVKSLTDSTTGATVTIFAATTSTAAGTVVISDSNGNSKTTHIKGLSTMPYKLALTSVSSAALGGKITMTGKVQDAFGNDLTTSLPYAGFAFTQVGATAPANNATDFDYNTTTKVYTIRWTAPTTAQAVAVQAAIAPAYAPTAVTAFGTPVSVAFASVNVQDLETQLAAVTAQVAALTAQLAASVSKAKYNKLARKWNRANPSNRVKLQK